MAVKKRTKKQQLQRIHDRYELMVDADRENRLLAMEDMRFITVPGEQWDDNMKQERGDRPCYEFNKTRVTCKRIINDMRANRPMGKVRGVEGGDKKTAEVYEGLIRNIWNTSDGDSVIDYAAEYQVGGGMGGWRILTDYASDSAFEQDIKVEALHNPYCLWWDPAARDQQKRDAMDCIYTERISKEAYKTRWPDAKPVDFQDNDHVDTRSDNDWEDEETVRIAEYWEKVPHKKELWQLQDGKVIDAASDEAALIDPNAIKNTRVVDTHKIMQCIASGDAILEGPTEWAGSMLPFVSPYGEYIVVEGEVFWFGVTRFAKDAQRSYNVSRTAISEAIAMAPQAKFWATPKQAEGHTGSWAEAHRKNFPFQLYNPDPVAPGVPQRNGGADVPVALIQESQIASEEIKAVTGIFSPDLGAGDQAKSGVQERERRAQGQIATFNYQDNMAKGIRRTWEILIDLIPQIYDTERELRVLGSDGAEDYVTINTFTQDPETGERIKIHDLSMGRYDVNITVGPSFTSQRQEASEVYMQLSQANPAIFGVAGDLIFKSMDLPYSEDIAERLKAMLPPEIQQVINEDNQNMSPEVMAAMQQAQQAMQMVEQQMQQVQMAAQEVQDEQQQTEQQKTDVVKAIADLEVKQSRFEAKIAKETANLAMKEAGLVVKEAGVEGLVNEMERAKADDQEVESMVAQQTDQAVNVIEQMAEQFSQEALQVIEHIQSQKETKPKIVKVESKRVNGKLVAVPVYEAQPEG